MCCRWDGIICEFASIDWTIAFIGLDANECFDLFVSICKDLIDKYVPLKKLKPLLIISILRYSECCIVVPKGHPNELLLLLLLVQQPLILVDALIKYEIRKRVS